MFCQYCLNVRNLHACGTLAGIKCSMKTKWPPISSAIINLGNKEGITMVLCVAINKCKKEKKRWKRKRKKKREREKYKTTRPSVSHTLLKTFLFSQYFHPNISTQFLLQSVCVCVCVCVCARARAWVHACVCVCVCVCRAFLLFYIHIYF